MFGTTLKKHKFNGAKVKKKFEKYDRLSEIEVSFDPYMDVFPVVNKLGTIGSGNHFGEFQAIEKIEDQSLFESLNLNSKQVYLLVHSGSRNYGDHILEHVFFQGKIPVTGILKKSPLFDTYITAHDNALRFATINRDLIAKRILSQVQGADPELLFESVHNSITQEMHNGKVSFIHRKGGLPHRVLAHWSLLVQGKPNRILLFQMKTLLTTLTLFLMEQVENGNVADARVDSLTNMVKKQLKM